MAEPYPRKFGKYVLLKPLARGGMGEIYLAAGGELGFQKFCVVKKVIAEKTDRVKANRFLDEAKVVLRLAHANLVPTFDAGEVEGEFFIAMELVEGKDLREIWNRCVRTRTRIPLDVALHVGREIARALAYVHSHGELRLVHRDVAPPNILLSYFGEVKLTDFGLARSVLKQENTAPGVVFGRASYLSPEQARGETADVRTDIYSLGIVLWELVTGNQYLQLANLDPATAMSLVRHPRAQPASSKAPWISANLDAFLMRALAPARGDRFQTAEEMRKALSDVIAQVSPRADAERAADFLRNLYGAAIKEERAERDKLLEASAALLAPPAAAEPARISASRIPVPLAALDQGSTRLQFPKEEDSLGVDFTGRVIDHRYRVLRKIGEGGMGTVYAGEHVEIGKGVAIKILHPIYSTQQDLVERFRREARAASKIGHPNIIDVTDFGSTEDGCAYFVMEHLDGIDLADVLSHERRIAADRASEIAIQICGALSAAHAAGVIHRDLKPENIFLVARGGKADFVKVLDFGIARSMGRARRLTNPGVAMGTPEYMAPEQAEGGAIDNRSDIFSVGALLYEMVTGSPPQRTRDKALIPPRGIKTDVPEELERIVIRALDPEPAKRYQSMAQLEYDLVKSMHGRARAVSELLGLHEAEHGMVPTAEAPVFDEGDLAPDRRSLHDGPPASAAPAETPASPSRRSLSGERAAPPPARRERRKTTGDRRVLTLSPAPIQAPAAGRRALGAFAALVLISAAAIPIYRRLPWNARARAAAAAQVAASLAPPPRSAAELRAERMREEVAAVEQTLGGRFGFAELPVVESRLRAIRADGGDAIADTLGDRARGLLVKIADDELDDDPIDPGLAHYKTALALGTRRAEPLGPLVRALRARGEAALADDESEHAVRFAREMVALADGSAVAHTLLADCLHAAHEDVEAVSEYEKALALTPDDPALKRSLARARRARDAASTVASPARGGHLKRSPVARAPEPPASVAAAAAEPAPAPPPNSGNQAAAPDQPAKPNQAERTPEPDQEPSARPAPKPAEGESAAKPPSAPAEPAPGEQH